MYNIVPPLLLLLGLFGLIILLHNKHQGAEEKVIKKSSFNKVRNKSKWNKIFNKGKTDLFKEKIIRFFEKLLVRLRIIILRIDQLLARALEKIRIQKQPIEDKKILPKITKISKLSVLIDEKLSSNTLEEQEKELLITLLKEDFSSDSLINLARLYLFTQDFSSARWALLEAYHLDKDNPIIQDLLFELKEKETPS